MKKIINIISNPWGPVILMALLIALFSTVSFGQFGTTAYNSLAANSFIVVHQPGGNTTGLLISQLASSASTQAGIQYKDEGSNLGTSGTVTSINFTGAGVTATRASNEVTVTIPGDNLGNHTATTALNMSDKNIIGIDTMSFYHATTTPKIYRHGTVPGLVINSGAVANAQPVLQVLENGVEYWRIMGNGDEYLIRTNDNDYVANYTVNTSSAGTNAGSAFGVTTGDVVGGANAVSGSLSAYNESNTGYIGNYPKSGSVVLGTAMASAKAKRLVISTGGKIPIEFGIQDTLKMSLDTSGHLDMLGHKVKNLAAPTASGDATNKIYVDTLLASSIEVSSAMSPYTVPSYMDFLWLNATAGNISVTLPTPTAGKRLALKRIDNTGGRTITLTGTVDGSVNPTKHLRGTNVPPLVLVGTGTGWFIESGDFNVPQAWSPSITQSGADTVVAVRYASYTLSGDYVNYELAIEIAPVKSGGIITSSSNTFFFTPPVASNFAGLYDACGQATMPPYNFSSSGLPLHGGFIYTDAATDKVAATIGYTNTSIGGGSTTFLLQWRGQYKIL